jgi:hypothetical protein
VRPRLGLVVLLSLSPVSFPAVASPFSLLLTLCFFFFAPQWIVGTATGFESRGGIFESQTEQGGRTTTTKRESCVCVLCVCGIFWNFLEFFYFGEFGIPLVSRSLCFAYSTVADYTGDNVDKNKAMAAFIIIGKSFDSVHVRCPFFSFSFFSFFSDFFFFPDGFFSFLPSFAAIVVGGLGVIAAFLKKNLPAAGAFAFAGAMFFFSCCPFSFFFFFRFVSFFSLRVFTLV